MIKSVVAYASGRRNCMWWSDLSQEAELEIQAMQFTSQEVDVQLLFNAKVVETVDSLSSIFH